MNTKLRSRRINVVKRLEQQLIDGVKTKKNTRDEKIPLTDKDISRINNEIKRLKSLI